MQTFDTEEGNALLRRQDKKNTLIEHSHFSTEGEHIIKKMTKVNDRIISNLDLKLSKIKS